MLKYIPTIKYTNKPPEKRLSISKEDLQLWMKKIQIWYVCITH